MRFYLHPSPIFLAGFQSAPLLGPAFPKLLQNREEYLFVRGTVLITYSAYQSYISSFGLNDSQTSSAAWNRVYCNTSYAWVMYIAILNYLPDTEGSLAFYQTLRLVGLHLPWKVTHRSQLLS